MCFPYDFLNDIFFSLAYFIVRIQYIIQITYKICVNHLLMLLIRLPVNSRHSSYELVMFWESQQLYTDFGLHGGVDDPDPHIGVDCIPSVLV